MSRHTLLGAAALALGGCATTDPHERYAETLAKGVSENRKVAAASNILGELSETDAYAVQDRLVARLARTDGVAGLKGGNMTPGRGPPNYGALLRSGRQVSPATLRLSDFRLLALETEIGFVIDRRIDARVDDLEKLRRAVRAIVPVVELPDFPFASVNGMTGTDVIAANIAACGFIEGAARPASATDPNAVDVTLTHDGVEVNQGRGSSIFGDQWRALQWIVNASVARGRPVEAGHLVITGTIGRPIPAKPGSYRADYGALGAIDFTVLP